MYLRKGENMKIHHLNLTVTDVPATQEFLETYFGMTCRANRGKGFAIMHDEDGFVLTLMKGREAKSNIQRPSILDSLKRMKSR